MKEWSQRHTIALHEVSRTMLVRPFALKGNQGVRMPLKNNKKRSNAKMRIDAFPVGIQNLALRTSIALILTVGALTVINVYANSLEETLQSAISYDKALASASSNRQAAAENIGIARSRLLPQVNLQGFRQKLNQTTTQNTSLGPQANVFQGDSYQYQLSLRQGLFRPRDVVGFSLGQQQALYGELKYESAKADLYNRAAGTWLDVLAALSNKALYQSTIKTIAESAQQERLRYEKGDGTKDSMIEAQAQLIQAKSMLEDAELNLEAKLQTHRLLTGNAQPNWDKKGLPSEDKVFFDKTQKDALLERIKAQSPEILAAKAVEAINASRVNQSISDHLPTLDLVASSTQAQNDTTNTLGYTYQNKSVGLQLTLPLFAGGGLEASRRQAVATFDASVADRESLQFRAETQFENDWATQSGLLERTKAARSLMFSAVEQKKAALAGVNKGLRTWTDVSNVELLLARRTSDLISIQTNLYKIQARILSLLPAQDEAWANWIRTLDVATSQQ
jgi:outer membrane protein, protease secretion system